MPTDISTRYRLGDLPEGLERTFWRLYEMAGGHGQDGRLPRLPLRRMAALTRRPRTTLRRHLRELHDRGLVVTTMLDRVVIPLRDVERRFAQAPRQTKKHDEGSRSRATNGSARRDIRQLPIMAGLSSGGPPRRTKSVHPGGPPHPEVLRTEERTYVASPETADPDELHPEVIAELTDGLGECFSMLQKFARRSPVWLQVLALPHERRQLIDLRAEVGDALFRRALSLAQDTLEPGFTGKAIAKPVPWLRGTGRHLAGESSRSAGERDDRTKEVSAPDQDAAGGRP